MILTQNQFDLLEDLDYEGLVNDHAQEEAVTCALHFETVRDTLFEYPWAFSLRAAALSNKSVGVGGYRFLYQMPEDCVNVYKIVLPRGSAPDYIRIDDSIACDFDDVTLYYGIIVEDVEVWPPLFREAFIARLAATVSVAMAGLTNLSSMASQLFINAIEDAYRSGAINNSFSLDNSNMPVSVNTKRLVSPVPGAPGK